MVGTMINPAHIVARFHARSAGELPWKERTEEREFNVGPLDAPVIEKQTYRLGEAVAPNKWKYEIQDWAGRWTVTCDKKAAGYTGGHTHVYVTINGGEQRGPGSGNRTTFPTFEAAKAAAEKHYNSLTASPVETDPQKLVHMLTPAQKAIILEAYDNGGMLEPDYGTRSERPVRQQRTRLMKQLAPMGIFNAINMKLYPLGIEIAKLLK